MCRYDLLKLKSWLARELSNEHKDLLDICDFFNKHGIELEERTLPFEPGDDSISVYRKREYTYNSEPILPILPILHIHIAAKEPEQLADLYLYGIPVAGKIQLHWLIGTFRGPFIAQSRPVIDAAYTAAYVLLERYHKTLEQCANEAICDTFATYELQY